MQRYTHLIAGPYLSIAILKKHIRYNTLTEKYIDLYLYDQLQLDLLEKSRFVFRY